MRQYLSVLLPAWEDRSLIAEGLSTLEKIIESSEFKNLDTDHYVVLATHAGRLYGQIGDFASAVDCLTSKALKNCSFVWHRSVCAVAIHELASMNLYQYNFEAAAKGYRKALWLAASVVPGRLAEVAANCVGLATVRLNLCQFRRALLFAEIGGCLSTMSGDLRHAAASAAVRGLARKALGQIGTARRSFLDGIEYATRSNSDLERARLLICLGWLELDSAVVEGGKSGRKPLEYFTEARGFARHVGDAFYEFDAQLGCVWSALANDDLSFAVEATNSIPRNYGEELPGYLELGLAAARGSVALTASDFAGASLQFSRVIDHVSGKQGCSLWKSVGLIGVGSLEWHSGNRQKAEAAWNQARSTGRSHSPFRARVVDASITRCRASATEPPH